MEKLKQGFVAMNRVEQVSMVIGLISSVLVIVTAIMQIADIWDMAMNACQILMGITMITQAIIQWKRNRWISVFSMAVAVFIFAVAAFIFFMV